MNGEEQEGFGMFDTTMHEGERAGVAKYYLNPVLKEKTLQYLKIHLLKKFYLREKKLSVFK